MMPVKGEWKMTEPLSQSGYIDYIGCNRQTRGLSWLGWRCAHTQGQGNLRNWREISNIGLGDESNYIIN